MYPSHIYLFNQHALNRIGGVMVNVFASWSHHLTKNGGLGPATFHWSAYSKWAAMYMYIGVSILPLSTIVRFYFFIVHLGYTIRNIMLKVSVHFNTQRLTCNSRRWLEHDKNQYALSQLMGFQPFPLYWISNVCTDINNQDRVAQTSLKYKSHLNLKCKSISFIPLLNLIEVSTTLSRFASTQKDTHLA
jgi:hypothetical protein